LRPIGSLLLALAVVACATADPVFEEIESNQWRGTVDGRRVIRFSTFRHEDGAWDWVELTYCER